MYGGEGDIVVLCAYLGQLARVRDALADKVAVIIDERDQRELLDREAEKDLEDAVTVEQVKVSRRVNDRVSLGLGYDSHLNVSFRFGFEQSTIIKEKRQRFVHSPYVAIIVFSALSSTSVSCRL